MLAPVTTAATTGCIGKIVPYYGFGMGATSYTCNLNALAAPAPLTPIAQWVEDYLCRWRRPDRLRPHAPCQEQWLDQLMVGLRLREGIDLWALAETYGAAAVAELQAHCSPQRFKRAGGWLIQVLPPRLRLTDPEGFLFSNQVLGEAVRSLGRVIGDGAGSFVMGLSHREI
jgi:coproporphyrinogen III oxidase-like Fe-S oxidoreductase